MWSQLAAQRAIIVAGCFGMAYTQLTMSPATIKYALSLGAGGVHIGILGALPAAMLFMQFVAAVTANRLRYRRRLWLTTTILQRLVLVPMALAPLLFDGVDDRVWLWGLVSATALNHALMHFGTPLWLSWMGDYLPHRGLSRFWGVRHLWMQLTATATLLSGALFLHVSGFDVRFSFAVLIVVGAAFGVADLLFFLKIDEPPVTTARNPRIRDTLAAPFRRRGFRSFIGYTCAWQFAAMIGAPFITLYLLSSLGMSLFQLMLLWAASWIGGAMMSRQLGNIVETFGNRPVLVICSALKSTNMLALLAVASSPAIAFWILIPVFMIDAVLNAGIAIASNGFMLKNSPTENRTMYIAAGTAIAGMVGGITSIAAGVLLSLTGAWQLSIAGTDYNHFHLLFAASVLMRLTTTVFALRIEEPESRGTDEVVTLLVGVTPLRMLRFPVGLYRTVRNGRDVNEQPITEPAVEKVA